MSSIRKQIIDNIASELNKITIAHGYNQDIKYVEKNKLLPPDQLTLDQFPAAFIIAAKENKKHADVDAVESDFEVIVEGVIKSNADTDDMQQLSTNLINDIEKCLMVDETRGGIAIDTHCFQVVTDYQIFIGYSVFDLHFNINYFHDRYNPSSQNNSPT